MITNTVSFLLQCLQIMRSFLKIICGKNVLIMQNFIQLVCSNVDAIGLSNVQDVLYNNTMNTSILSTLLALYSQNKHHFCQVLQFDLFLPFIDSCFFIQQIFSLLKLYVFKLICVCGNGNLCTLVTRNSMGQWKTGYRKWSQNWYPGHSQKDMWNT